ncbi:hypothetical protein ACLB2K_061146 [Fragaria x ananassa]
MARMSSRVMPICPKGKSKVLVALFHKQAMAAIADEILVKSCHRNWQHAGEVVVVEVENTEVSEVGELRRERAVEDVVGEVEEAESGESGEAGVGVVEGGLEGEEGAVGGHWARGGGE